MAILATGNTFSTGDQVTAATLNAAVNSATFASGAVDGSTTQLSGGSVIVKDGGITGAKLASNITISTSGSISGGAGSFTTLGTSGQITVTKSTGSSALGLVSGNTTGVYQYFETSAGIKGYLGTGDQIIGGGSVSDIILDSSAGDVVIATAEAQRGRFSSTGLAVTGAVSATTKVFAGAQDTSSAAFCGSFTSAIGNGINLTSHDDASGASFAVFLNGSVGAVGSITRVTTTNAVTYNTTSDGRLKENFRDFTDSGRLIDSLRPRIFDWKSSTDDNGKNVVGFIAQEENAADPIFAHIGAVSVGDDDPTTISKQWQRSDSALVPILVAELKSLRARVAALEAK